MPVLVQRHVCDASPHDCRSLLGLPHLVQAEEEVQLGDGTQVVLAQGPAGHRTQTGYTMNVTRKRQLRLVGRSLGHRYI